MEVILIKLDRRTAKRIKNIKIAKRESYDEIINRVLDKYDKKNNE